MKTGRRPSVLRGGIKLRFDYRAQVATSETLPRGKGSFDGDPQAIELPLRVNLKLKPIVLQEAEFLAPMFDPMRYHRRAAIHGLLIVLSHRLSGECPVLALRVHL